MRGRRESTPCETPVSRNVWRAHASSRRLFNQPLGGQVPTHFQPFRDECLNESARRDEAL
jgi:hypothetical protein